MPSSASASEATRLRLHSGRAAPILAVAVLTVAAAAWTAHRFAADPPAAHLAPPADPYVRLDREITTDFGMEQPVAWVLEAREGTIWTPAMLARLQAMTREVLTIPGVIPLDVMSIASPNMRDVRVTEDGLEPVYLMNEPPSTAEAADTLRRRIEGDPNYHGTLVSRDGRAALVVANLRTDADVAAAGQAALALRDRYRDTQAMAYVTGAPVMAVATPLEMRPIAAWAAALAAAALALLWLALGGRGALAALVSAGFAVVWTSTVLAAAGLVLLPWTAFALLATALVAVAVTTTRPHGRRVSPQFWGAALLSAGATSIATHQAAQSFATAMGLGLAMTALAIPAARMLLPAPAAVVSPSPAPWARWAALAIATLALLGAPRLHMSFSLGGYGQRYLPPAASADLNALSRLFPPPAALAVRVRGQPGFVSSPTVLRAIDAVADAARADPSVRSAMSVADLVKLVSKAFNENQPAFAVIPDDPGMAGRYLALGYSPGFRRFVDRALATAVIWIYLDSEDPRDIARVLGRIERQLAERPVPDAQVDIAGGDGAVVLVMARTALTLAGVGLVLVLIIALGAAAFGGAGCAVRALLGGAATIAVGAGLLGWLGLPMDLLSVPLLIGSGIAAAVASAAGASGNPAAAHRLALGQALTGAVALASPFAILQLLGLFLLAPAVGSTVATKS